ncbi:MAG: hypothetical protein U0X76_00105 [Bacteroidia bacterium]
MLFAFTIEVIYVPAGKQLLYIPVHIVEPTTKEAVEAQVTELEPAVVLQAKVVPVLLVEKISLCQKLS